MAILKDLIVHGSSRFLNKIYASEIQTPLIEAEAGIFKKLKADDATVVGLLDVKGQLHTNSWSNSNIATIDGSFYITPTIGSASGTVTITASSLNFSGTNYAVTSLYLGDNSSITWPQYSKVLVTGQILSNGEWIPLGTLLGQLSAQAAAASIKINNIKDNKNQTSSILTALVNNGTTSSNYRNLKVSLYQRASSSTAFYPLGIYITAAGDNGRTFLDIYGGVNPLNTTSSNYGGFAEPNVRIGNLQGLPNVGGQSPNGWGIYTDNGYFKGIIAADRGYIGTGSKYWVIGNYEDGSNSNNDRSYIYNGTNSITSTTEGVYLGTDGIRNYKDSTHYVTIKNGVISALGVDLSGKIIATSGTIGGASITNGTLIVSNANISDINASKINAGDIAAARIQTNLISAINAKVSDLSALTATIGGFQIDSSSIHTKSVAITSNVDNSIALSSADFTRTINSTNRAGLRFAIGDKFGVTGDGTIYASNVDLTGKIIATSGTIGGIEIENGVLKVSSINIGNLGGASNYAKKTDVTQAIDNIEVDIEDAKKVATNYLSIDSTGIMVADMNDGEQTPSTATGNNVFIDNTSVNIRDGQTTLASFGVDGMQIGLKEESHINQNYHSWRMIDKEGNVYAYISDLRDATGVATITETDVKLYTASGTTYIIPAFGVNSIVSITINDSPVSSYTVGSNNYVKTTPSPAEGDSIKLVYTSANYLQKAYTLGMRKSDTDIGALSFAEGYNITASGHYSHAEGYYSKATGYSSHAEGVSNATGEFSHAECRGTASGSHSHAERGVASGNYSHAEGGVASGFCSHSENVGYASGGWSHAEGESTKATGDCSHAEGEFSEANGEFSHAEGYSCIANGKYSHAQNRSTRASSEAQTAIGKYNIEDTSGTYAFIIGNGVDPSQRSNAFSVAWSGNTIVKGNLEVNGKLSTPLKTLSISRVISTTYMSATDFARLHAYQKNGMLYLNFNALFNGSNYTVSDTTTIATISNWNAIDNAIISVPCQNDGTKVMTITVTTDGAIRVYSTKAIYGWYRTFICVPSRS